MKGNDREDYGSCSAGGMDGWMMSSNEIKKKKIDLKQNSGSGICISHASEGTSEFTDFT